MKVQKTLQLGALTALAVGALTFGGAAAANAATTAPVVNAANTIIPGDTADVGVYISNQAGTAQTGPVTLFLTAPSNSTFSANEVWGTQVIQGVKQSNSAPVLTNCVLSNGNKNMTCTGTLTIPAAGNGKLSGVVFTTPVAVSSSAPNNTTFTDGVFNMTNGGTISGGRTNLQYVSGYNTDIALVQPSVPTIAPGGTGTLTVDVQDPAQRGYHGNMTYDPIVFTAPTNTTFTTGSVGVAGGGTITCDLSSDHKTITCPGPNGLPDGTGTGTGLNHFALSVQVDASAPQNTTLTGGTATWTERAMDGLQWRDPDQSNNTNVPLAVRTPTVVDTPLIPVSVAGSILLLGVIAGGFVLARRARQNQA